MALSRLLIAPAAGLWLASAVLGAPPTDADIEAISGKLQAYWQENRSTDDFDSKFKAFCKETLAGLDLAEMSVAQIQPLAYPLGEAGRMDDVLNRFGTLAETPDADGARAAVAMVGATFDATEAQKTRAVTMVLTHPGFKDIIATREGMAAFSTLSRMDKSILAPHAKAIIGLGDAFTEDIPVQALGGLSEYVSIVNALGDSVPVEVRKSARQRVVDLISGGMARAKESGDERSAGRLERTLAYLNGAAGRGELINHMAPAVELTWYSDEGGPATLAGLKGKVVIVDFWATWCGPCVASFPNVAELQERYNGYDVVIVGLTSLQEKHYPGGADPIDCTGDPEKEYGLMKEFMADKGMTWKVAFSKHDVFNPEFGVRGIPHVAIIDAAGKVRYNGLHPSATSLAEKAKKIDGLLKEAGLPAPAPLTE